MRWNLKTVGVACLAVSALAPSPGAPAGPSADDEAMALLREFVRPGADHAALSGRLRPTKADYTAVFAGDLAAKLPAIYDPAWDGGALVIKGKPGQETVLLRSASSEELKAWTGPAAAHFPGGWKDVGPHLKPGLRVYAFKFVESGQALGMAFDGLVKVNGQWRIFPKPWRAVR